MECSQFADHLGSNTIRSEGGSDFFMTIVNIYAPTNKAPPHVKLQFGEELQSVMDSM